MSSLDAIRFSDEEYRFEGVEYEDLENDKAWISARRPVVLEASR